MTKPARTGARAILQANLGSATGKATRADPAA